MGHVNATKVRRPIFGGMSLGVPILGIACGWLAAVNSLPSSGDNWNALIILGFSGAASVLCGFALAVVGLLRRERLILFSWMGLILNFIPIIWLLDRSGIMPGLLGF